MNKYKLQFFFVLFFALDKLLLIPDLRYKITSTLPGNPYQETVLPADYEERIKEKKAIWLFGTSRTFPFYRLPVPEQTAIDPYTNEIEKAKIGNYEFYPFAYPASTPSLYYVQLIKRLEKGYRPDFVALELSAFAFNQNIRFVNAAKIEGIPLDFAISHYDVMPPSYLSDILVSRLFATSRYKVSLSAIKRNVLGIEESHNSNMVKEFQDSNKIDPFTTEIINYNSDFKKNVARSEEAFHDYEGEEPMQKAGDRFLKIELPVKMLKGDFYNHFKMNEDMFHFLNEIVAECRKRDIPLLFWIPRDHRAFRESLSDLEELPLWKQRIEKIAEQPGIMLLDLQNDNTFQCNYYKDVIHLSHRCYTEISHKIISKIESQPNNREP